MKQEHPEKDSSYLAGQVNMLKQYIFYSFGGGPKIVPLRYNINIFKGLTAAWIMGLMFYFDNFSDGMYLYLFIHGSYGMAWLLKDLTFPDQTFKRKASIGSHILLALFLWLYWFIPIPLALGWGVQSPNQIRIATILLTYFVGLFLMLGADYQKTSTLKKRKGLISSGFFKSSRNPNYLGEALIYLSFAVCSGHWFSYAIFFGATCPLFALSMYTKDKMSYEKKEGWPVYRQNSYILFPKIFSSHIINFVFYGVLFIAYGYANSIEI